MATENDLNETEVTPKKMKRFRLNYEWIVHRLPFILFLSLLALLYIANGHYADKNIREINKTRSELKELHWKYLNVKSDLMFRSKFSEVSKSVESLGLKELDAPPIIIAEDTTKNKN